jgi:hypothetical protein
MTTSPFYTADELDEIATNLFYGWGYNFYRLENQLRADDLMIRARCGELLGQTRAAVAALESAHRRDHLPPPTRQNPLPDPAAVRRAQALESLGREIGALEGEIRALPAPESDRMTERLRTEAETLTRLLAADRALIAHADLLRRALTQAREADAPAHISALKAALAARRALLI